jgi:hypothetical protein
MNIFSIISGTIGRVIGKILLVIGILMMIIGIVLSVFVITAIVGIPILIIGVLISLIGAAINARGKLAVYKGLNKNIYQDNILKQNRIHNPNVVEAEFIEKNEKDKLEKI